MADVSFQSSHSSLQNFTAYAYNIPIIILIIKSIKYITVVFAIGILVIKDKPL